MRILRAVVFSMLLILISAFSASGIVEDNRSKLICNGEGKIAAVPDLVVITLGVETRNISASGAAAENAQLMNRTVTALLNAGIKDNEIQTSHYSLTREEDEGLQEWNRRVPEKPPEFVASNRVTVKINASEEIGKVLDAAIAAGSNNIIGISFDLNDPKNETDKALALAMEDAQRKAEVMAKAAGVKLLRVLEISEGYSVVSSLRAERAALSFDSTTPIQRGLLEVTASITATFEIA